MLEAIVCSAVNQKRDFINVQLCKVVFELFLEVLIFLRICRHLLFLCKHVSHGLSDEIVSGLDFPSRFIKGSVFSYFVFIWASIFILLDASALSFLEIEVEPAETTGGFKQQIDNFLALLRVFAGVIGQE